MKKIKISMFIDALGFEIAKQYNFLEKEFPYKKSVEMQFGYSNTALPTILSGESPESHEHFTLYYRSPKSSPFKHLPTNLLSLLPRVVEGNWRIRSRVSKLIKKLVGFTGYFELYSIPVSKLRTLDYSEKKDIFDADGIENVENLKDLLLRKKVPHHISDWRKSEDENIQSLKKDISKGEIQFAFLYTAKLDALLHSESKDGDNIAEKLKWYEEHIYEILKMAKEEYDEVEFCVFSDHGMTTYKESLNVKELIKKSGLKEGKDFEMLLDSTMGRFWYHSDEARNTIRDILQDHKGEFLDDKKLKKWGVLFLDRKYGEDIFLVEPGIQIVPSDMGNKPLKGMHGYSPDDKDSNASFIANFKPVITPTWVGDFFKIMTDDL